MGAALLTVFSALLFLFVPLPRGYYPEFIVQRPEEFIPALFFLFTLIGYLYKGLWKRDIVEHWLVMSLLVGSVSQILVMPCSSNLFDMSFDLAHGLKIISYIMILTGLLVSMHLLFRQAEDSVEEIKHANLTLSREIVERKVTEHALQQNKNLLNTAEAIVHLGSWERNIKTGEETWSDEQWRIFGYEPNTVTPKYEIFLNALHPDDRERVLETIQNTMEHDTPYDIAFKIRRPDGKIRFCQATGIVYRDADGLPERMIGTVLDITDHKQTEQNLVEKQRLLDAFHHIGEATIATFEIDQIQNILVKEIVQAGIFRSLTMAIIDHQQRTVCVVKTLVRRSVGIVDISEETDLTYHLDDTNIIAETARLGEMQVVEGWDDRLDINIDGPGQEYQDKVFYSRYSQ
jgi:PAS domain S-box-containing protein